MCAVSSNCLLFVFRWPAEWVFVWVCKYCTCSQTAFSLNYFLLAFCIRFFLNDSLGLYWEKQYVHTYAKICKYTRPHVFWILSLHWILSHSDLTMIVIIFFISTWHYSQISFSDYSLVLFSRGPNLMPLSTLKLFLLHKIDGQNAYTCGSWMSDFCLREVSIQKTYGNRKICTFIVI